VNTKARKPRGAVAQVLDAKVGHRWLYDFARLKPGLLELPAKDRTRVAWEALRFAKGRSWDVGQHDKPPAWKEVTSAHFHLWTEVFRALKMDGVCAGGWAGEIRLRPDGTLNAHTRTDELGFMTAFRYQAIDFLRRQGARGIRLRFCEQCGLPFPAKRPDARLCPGTSCRQLAWRRKNREAFRKSRNAAYRRTSGAKAEAARLSVDV
jgi:hypothetical protein